MNPILSNNYYVNFKADAYTKLNGFIASKSPSSVFILTDTNTNTYCLPILEKQLNMVDFKVIKIPAGEDFKNLNTCTKVWDSLTNLGADRKSLLINLGGGVVTDLGGFVGSCFKRGIDFINIPTTLLSMVDASVGGKTGVDLGVLKNQIGLFANPKMVLIDTTYLSTLEERDLRSGIAEIIKYGLTYDIKVWNDIKTNKNLLNSDLNYLIYRSVQIKNEVVLKDLKENNIRKVLNFGHTLGHAIESYFLDAKDKETITHGEAIAVGIITECFLSQKVLGFSSAKVNEVKTEILKLFPKIDISPTDYKAIFAWLKHDKKNVSGEVNFVLLSDFENFKLDCKVELPLLSKALDFYSN